MSVILSLSQSIYKIPLYSLVHFPDPPPGAEAVMQHVDLKSIYLSPLFDFSCASPLVFLSRGSAGGVCLLAHGLYVLRSAAPGGAEWMKGLSGSR